MFAGPADMEPGMPFRTHNTGAVLRWVGVEAVVSRFAGKRRVRVFATGAAPFVVDVSAKFQVVDWSEGK